MPKAKSNLIHRTIIKPAINLLIQGVSPSKLSLAIVIGLAFGLSPLYGLTTILCLLVALVFRLNILLMQAINYLLWPLQVLLIIPYIKMAEKIFHGSWLPENIDTFFKVIRNNPRESILDFILGIMAASLVWIILIIPLSVLLYFLFRFLFLKIKIEKTIIEEKK
jgi:uncharacterized protein (DUF2062 family)